MKYIIGIDQSTQSTKALLFDEAGDIVLRRDLLHRQIIDDHGWVEHDPEEIIQNVVLVVQKLLEEAKVEKDKIMGIGISNQRETAMVWNRETGVPLYNAIVWQCKRGASICEEIEAIGKATFVKERTGMNLSPYFSAAKIAWILRNVEEAASAAQARQLCCGTMDSWLVYKLTGGQEFKTDYSNASRTQMFNITTLEWDEEVCMLFGIDTSCLAKVCYSDSLFGETDFFGFFSKPIPIHGVLGDSHGALFGQGCHENGMVKATYGTGSSVMMNIGRKPVFSEDIVTSLAWGLDGRVDYVLEGNINYTGAVVTWLKEDLQLISTSREVGELAATANPNDKTYIVPAFSGLGAPYWNNDVTGIVTGITRHTGRAEFAKAVEECIAYQIADIVAVMNRYSITEISELRVDGGPTRDRFLMQFQSDILGIPVNVPETEELSGMGVAYVAGIALEIFDIKKVFARIRRTSFAPQMPRDVRDEKLSGWKNAINQVIRK